MATYHFHLPDVGEGVAEAEIVVWHVQIGDTVKEDQSLVDVMTDKATVDMTSPVDGVVTAIHGEVGAMMPVGSVLVELEVEGAGNVAAAPIAQAPELQTAPEPEPEPAPTPVETSPISSARTPPSQSARRSARAQPRIVGSAPFAAPATRRKAYELGIPLQFVTGTGPGGRILPEDLDTYIASGGQLPNGAQAVERHAVHETRIIGLRRKIAEKMQEAKRRIPHIAYVEECDVSELESLRADLNANPLPDQPKLTLLPFLMRAMARALPDFPQINALYDDDAGILHSHEGVHIGIATQTPGGLMVPVVRHVEALSLWECARELARVSAAAKAGTATRDELYGSTITITSLGVLGGIVTTPVINHPEVAIVGPNKIVEKPVIQGNFVSVRKTMNLSSSFDHRIVDGYDAALFVQRLKRLVEHPALIFMDDSR